MSTAADGNPGGSTAAGRTPGRRIGRQAGRAWSVRAASLIAFLVIWEVFGRRVNPLFMSYPSAIAATFAQMVASGELLKAALDSGRTFLVGYLAACVAGVAIGLLMGRFRLFEAAVDVYVGALYATPLVAFIPLVMLWFGLGFVAKAFIVFLLAVFPILINTHAGVRNVDARLLEVAHAFCARESDIFSKVVLPDALPFVMTGLRLGVGRAIIGMVIAEFFMALTGLGAVIINAANNFQTARMFVPILVLMIAGALLMAGLQALEGRIAFWHHTEGSE